MNPWHDIEVKDPNLVPALIEIPKGSSVKFELDKKTGMIIVDRVLYASAHYPDNYGFIPQTYCDDGDPLDILVLGQALVYPNTLMRAKPIGVMRMTDQGKLDDKIIAVHADDPEYMHYEDLGQLAPHIFNEIRHFFEIYKQLEGKEVSVEGFKGRIEAIRIIEDGLKLYAQNKEKLRA